MYVAVKGGEAAIRNAHRLLADRRRGDRSVPALRLDQIVEQLALGVDRVMSEGSLYDRELAALAITQARGDMIEAIFLVRAYRTTLPRFGYTRPVDTAAMQAERRISARTRICRAGRCSDLPSIIRIACSIRNSPQAWRCRNPNSATRRLRRCRASPTSWLAKD